MSTMEMLDPSREKASAVGVELATFNNAKDLELVKQAAEDEHAQTFVQAIRQHPTAVLWSLLLSTSIIMEGYDIVLISSFFAQPAFSERYGSFDPGSDSYQISASWQNGLINAATVGTIIGAFLNGYLTPSYGYRKILLFALVLITGFIALPFSAPNLPVLLVGQFLCGIPWGIFATMAPAYASEVCPLALRGYLTVYVNLCWAIGQLISAGVQAGFAGGTGMWSYRIPFAIQWVWPVPLFFILWFAPESPWYLVRREEYQKAEQNLIRLGCAPSKSKQTLAMMVHTNELEKEMNTGTSYLDCFHGVDRYRTEIACMAFAAQPFCGSALASTPTYFFVQAGLPVSISFRLAVGSLGLAAVGTIIAWFMMSRLGRRTLYLWGLGILTALLLVVGIISASTIHDSVAGNYAQASLLLVWEFVYYMTVGPICYAIITEVSSTRLRNESISLSRICYYVAQIASNAAEPYLINPTAANLQGKTAFVWGAFAFIFFVWTFFRLPETKDRTYEELDIMFLQGVKARDLDSYRSDIHGVGNRRAASYA
ncbi:sugar transporter [Astrocystis sublimbata]|nr:sugar transporter [Astrocystis sublimbata]